MQLYDDIQGCYEEANTVQDADALVYYFYEHAGWLVLLKVMELGGACRLDHVELRGTSGAIQLGLQGVSEILGKTVNSAEKEDVNNLNLRRERSSCAT